MLNNIFQASDESSNGDEYRDRLKKQKLTKKRRIDKSSAKAVERGGSLTIVEKLSTQRPIVHSPPPSKRRKTEENEFVSKLRNIAAKKGNKKSSTNQIADHKVSPKIFDLTEDIVVDSAADTRSNEGSVADSGNVATTTTLGMEQPQVNLNPILTTSLSYGAPL